MWSRTRNGGKSRISRSDLLAIHHFKRYYVLKRLFAQSPVRLMYAKRIGESDGANVRARRCLNVTLQ